MAKEKRTGQGAKISIDFTGADSTYDVLECTSDLTPPGSNNAAVAAACLEDDEITHVPGQGEATTLVFNQFWHPTNTTDAKVDAARASRTTINVKIEYPFSTKVDEKWNGFVEDITPDNLGGNIILSRQITIRRTTPITYADQTP